MVQTRDFPVCSNSQSFTFLSAPNSVTACWVSVMFCCQVYCLVDKCYEFFCSFCFSSLYFLKRFCKAVDYKTLLISFMSISLFFLLVVFILQKDFVRLFFLFCRIVNYKTFFKNNLAVTTKTWAHNVIKALISQQLTPTLFHENLCYL